MKLTFSFILMFVSCVVYGGSGDSWYTGFPKQLDLSPAKHQLSNTYFSEIPVSQSAAAEQLLESKSIVPIQNGYFGSYPACPAKTTPYLVRAVFERTNSTFFVDFVGSNLLVLAFAPGLPDTQHRSAIVVCAVFEPTRAYTAAGGPL